MRTAFTSFKPQLESLEGRELPSGVGAPALLAAPVVEQNVQAMQQAPTTLNTVCCPVAPVGHTLGNPAAPVGQTLGNPAVFSPASNPLVQRGLTDLNALGRDAQSLGAFSVALASDAQALNQAVFMALGDADQALAAYEYLQLNGSIPFGSGALGQAQCPTAPASPANPFASPAAPASPASPAAPASPASPAAPASPANPFASPAAPANEIALLFTLDGNPS